VLEVLANSMISNHQDIPIVTNHDHDHPVESLSCMVCWTVMQLFTLGSQWL